MKGFQELNVRVTFYYPFRIIPWKSKEDRNTNEKYRRGGTFAKWHKIKDNIGRPYLTGTLIRSSFYKEIKRIIPLVNPFKCCNGIDETIESLSKPYFLRLRPKTTNDKPCSSCLLCQIMGRTDTTRRKDKIQKNNSKEHWTVHFSNFREGTEREFDFDHLAVKRIVNRVDTSSGKAKDYMKIWEVDPCICPTFNGTITINTKVLDEKQVQEIKLLLAAGLSQINVIAGSICKVDIIEPDNHQILISEFTKLIKSQNSDIDECDENLFKPQNELPKDLGNVSDLANQIANIFNEKERDQRLRRLADTIRELRHETYQIIDKLPTGKQGGQKSIWERYSDSLSIRQMLKEKASFFKKKEQFLWRKFCEDLGDNLYKLIKKPGAESFRLLGETELYGRPAKKIDETISETGSKLRYHFIIIGQLIAQTPFYFGVENQSDQTSAGVLVNRNGHFYLPRTVIRGALRRDLGFLHKICNAKVGEYCDCDICKITRNIVIEDALSDCFLPPEIRYRIRLNPHTGTVEEGALFDMEAGYQGLKFPLRLHIYSSKNTIDDSIIQVIYSWKNNQAIFGGDTGAGFGRFNLSESNLKVFALDISKPEHIEYIMLFRGFKGSENVKKLLQKAEKDKKIVYQFKNKEENWKEELKSLGYSYPLPWEKISYKIKIASPLISRDPINALIDQRNVDSVMIKKRIFDQFENKIKFLYMIKGESIRGIFRSILMKSNPEEINESVALCDMDHEDCYCILCRLFGNVHHQGKLRFEDAEVINISPEKKLDIKMDHVAIDRFTGGGVDQMKFDDYPIPGAPKDKALELKGTIWVKKDLDKIEQETMNLILSDFKNGVMPLGGLGAIGYGFVSDVEWDDVPEWFSDIQKKSCVKILSNDRYKIGDSPEIKLDKKMIYHPHYFIPPLDKKVSRVNANGLISHVRKLHDGKELLSGTISCSLKTLGPIFIPTAADEKEDYFDMNIKGHKSFGFFRINDHIAIPGSSIRGMISSVFETITHSCYRVMDEKKYITRRVIPESEETKSRKTGKNKQSEDKDEFLPGLVIKKGEEWYIKQMGKIVRLPIYDNLKLIQPTNKKDYQKECYSYMQSLIRAIEYNKDIAKAAEKNRQFLLSHEDAYEILTGKKEIYYTLHKQEYIDKRGKVKEINPNAAYACLTEKIEGCNKGFIKFTGADMVTVSKDPKYKIPFPSSFENKSSLYSFPLHNKMELRSSQKKKYPRPVIAYVKDGVEYLMHKRCERIFTTPDNDDTDIIIPKKIIKQYNNILEDNRNNSKNIPMIFQTIEHNKELSEGDLVYFKFENNKVTDLAPVSISREVDESPLGKRFPKNNESLRPCSRLCIEDCEDCQDTCENLEDFFKPHPEGLCPACHVFGTTSYKSRVNFGIAWLDNDPDKNLPKWYIKNTEEKGGKMTLPLLERPRPTWSMPEKKSTIPGRKFYIHHPWSVKKLKENQALITPNNRTIEPLDKGNIFKFEIKFHKLQEWELGLLLYSLELENNLAHKIGMAKAMGLGSVQIKVNDVLIYEGNLEKSDKISLIKKGFSHLGISNEDKIDNFPNIKNLRSILWIPSENNEINVRYPDLESKNDNIIPGYTDFIKEKDSETGEKNPNYLYPDRRRDLLQTPWKNWYPVIKNVLPQNITYTKVSDTHDKIKTGVVKWFDNKKGIGFIKHKDNSEYFVHHSSINKKGFRSLNDGEQVQFEVRKSEKRKGKFEAFNVTLI